MRQMNCGFASGFLGLLLIAVGGPAIWGYVNGGDYHSTLKTFANGLKSEGWSASFGTYLPADGARTKEVAEGVKTDPPDNPAYQRHINLLLGEALQSNPVKKEADKIPAETKREVARLAREAIRSALARKEAVIKKGQIGTLHYQVGACAFESYWETNYGGKRQTHARRNGLAPFIALKVVPAKEPVPPGGAQERK